MSEASISTNWSSYVEVKEPGRRVVFPLMLLLFMLAWLATSAHFMGDTEVYTRAILRHQHGLPEPDYHQMTANPFWDFGHILWRPLGWLCFVILKPTTEGLLQHSERAEAIIALVSVSFLASVASAVLFFLLTNGLVGNVWAALLATVGLFTADAFLNYAHTGHAYLPAMACLIAGMYVSCYKTSESAGRFLAAGVLLALMVLFWFPYIFVLPAAFAAPLLLRGFSRQRLRYVGFSVALCAVVGLTVYSGVIVLVGIRNLADLRAWILTAGHGQIQPGGVRALARLAFSIPRSFINMGHDGMLLKRYLVHDPYAPVTVGELLRLSLWKVLLFYAASGAVFLRLRRSDRGRRILLLLVLA